MRGVAVGTRDVWHMAQRAGWMLGWQRERCTGGMQQRPWMWQQAGWVAWLGIVCSVLLAGPVLAQTGITPSAADLEAGKQLYTQHCMHCHGETGDGKGASAPVVYPKPRDFTSGIYKFRTHHENANGNKMAADEDIFRSINDGWPANLTKPWTYRGGHSRRDIFRNVVMGITGTPMPAFADPDPMAEARAATEPQKKKDAEALAREVRENLWHTVNYVQSLWTYPE